jgi:hypothetical protein
MSINRLALVSMSLSMGLLCACATSPDVATGNAHEAAARTHLEFARDFRSAGNEAMEEYHVRQAELARARVADEECGLLCSIIETAFEAKPDSLSRQSCRDPITTPSPLQPRC